MKALALLTLRPDDRQVDFYRGIEADGYDLFVFVDDPEFQPERDDVRYEHVWVIEDDVFVPTLAAISALDRKYPEADIVSKENTINTSGTTQGWFWWKFIDADLLPLPWAKSMVCAVRFKPTVFTLLPGFVERWRAVYGIPDGGPLDYERPLLCIEYVFHTLALHAGLSVAVAEELEGVVYRRDWTVEEMQPGRLYHPVKQLDLQISYRRRLVSDQA